MKESLLEQIDINQLLEDLRIKYNVVGASLSVMHKGQVKNASSGILNKNTKIEATDDSLFQIGSISKIFTTTAIMQLVDEGKVNLEDPVVNYLPSFRVADIEASNTITVKQLLCHTSGMEGDFFPEDDPFCPTVEKLIDRCYLLEQLHPVDKYMSYCNTGFSIAGRIIEVITGKPWGLVIQERILQPLNLNESTTEPANMLRFRSAIGHVPDINDSTKLNVAPKCYLPLSHAPAGTVLSMSARDLMTFALMHLNDGVSDNGKKIISKESAIKMKTQQVQLPSMGAGITDWGLGWFMVKRAEREMYGHTGGTIGQLSYLSIYPKNDLVITLLTNSPSAMLYSELEKSLLDSLAGISREADLVPSEQSLDFNPFVGRYENIQTQVKVYEFEKTLLCEFPNQAGGVGLLELLHVKDNVFVSFPSPNEPPRNVMFIGEGKDEYLLTGGRLFKKKS